MSRDRKGAVPEVFNRFRYRSLTVAAHLYGAFWEGAFTNGHSRRIH